MDCNIKFVKLHSDVKAPQYMTEGASGFDVAAFWGSDLNLNKIMKPQDILIVPTGLKLEIPIDFEAQVRPRSGLAFKYGISIVNSPGTIDSDFRGEVKIALINLGKNDFKVKNGERIAQIVVSPVKRFKMVEVENLSETDRNDGGFGSTGS